MKSNRRILSILCILMTLAMLSMSVLAGAADTMSVQLPDLSSYYKDKDIDDTFEDDKAVHIVLTGTDWLADNENGFSCEDQVLTITTKGTYVLSGTWNGQIRVQVPEEDKVHLILNGVTVESPEGPAILELTSDKLIVTVQEGTENTLVCRTAVTDDDDTIGGALYAEDDLSINGTGILNAVSEVAHGIQSKADLILSGATLNVTSAKDGIRGRNSVLILSGTLNIAAQGDGICSTRTDKEGKGYVILAGGTVQITTGSGAGQVTASAENQNRNRGMYTKTSSSESDVSQKGIKAATDLYVLDGTLTLNCADDALHAVRVTLASGTMTIRSGDDAVHADEDLTILDGTIRIEQCYEGLEGTNVTILGGQIDIVSSDDGVNASGGSDMSGFGGRDQFGSWGRRSGQNPAQSNTSGSTGAGATQTDSAVAGFLSIQGGQLSVISGGDALDANGSLAITGGSVAVYAATTGGEGAIDFNGTGTISGGTLMVASSGGIMTDTAGLTGQTIMSIPLSSRLSAGTTLELFTGDGSLLSSLTLSQTCDTLLISSDQLPEGSLCSVAGNSTTLFSGTVTASSLAGSGAWGGGFGGGGFGGGGRRH